MASHDQNQHLMLICSIENGSPEFYFSYYNPYNTLEFKAPGKEKDSTLYKYKEDATNKGFYRIEVCGSFPKDAFYLPIYDHARKVFFANLTTFITSPSSSLSNPTLAYYSQELKKFKDKLEATSKDGREISDAIKESFFAKMYAQYNPSNYSQDTFHLSYFTNTLNESLNICDLFCSIKNYISGLTYDENEKKQILSKFIDLSKQSIVPQLQSSNEFSEISKRFMTNLTLAIESFNPLIHQSQSDTSLQDQTNSSNFHSIWSRKDHGHEKKSNILKRGNKVKPKPTYEKYTSNNIDQHYQQPSQQPLTTTPKVKSFAELNEKNTKDLYFTFIEKALRDTKKINHAFSFQDAILAIKIAKYFGGVSHKLNEKGNGYDELKIADINQSGLLSTNTIDEDKFKALKKFSALYQKHAGEYFLSDRDKKTSARLTFFPQRFLKDLEHTDAQTLVNPAKDNESHQL